MASLGAAVRPVRRRPGGPRGPGAAVAGLRRRAVITGLWMVLGLLLLCARLVQVQIGRGPALAGQDPAYWLRMTTLPAARGEITDRHGQVLALSVPADDVSADPTLIPAQRDRSHPVDATRVAADLSGVLGIPAPTLLQALQRPGRYAVLKKGATPEEGAAIARLQLPGIFLTPTTVRRYPNLFFMGSLLGFVNDSGGAYGLERSYNQDLSGTNGYVLAEEDPKGQPIAAAPSRVVAAKPGLTLELGVDAGLQASLEQQVEAAVATTAAQGAYGLVMQPDTGTILAAVAWPTYDPNHPGGATPAVWGNTVQSQNLVPGSIFKTVTGSAALQAGIVSPDTPFLDPGFLKVGGATLRNFQPLERNTTFQRAFDESANVVFAGIGLRLGLTRFYDYIDAFGLNAPPGSDLPGEQPNVLAPPSTASSLDLASEAFGETLSVTPLSMITAVNVIADGGLLIRPHVGVALRDGAGHVVRRIEPQVVRRVLSPAIAATMRQLMVTVVNDGTGQRGFLPCYDVAGKTGTANIYAGGRVTQQYIASFVAFAPADRPAAIALVMLVNPQGPRNEGGEVAAPAVQAVLSDALHTLGVPPHCTADNVVPPAPGAAGTTGLVLDMVPMPALQGLTPTAASAAAGAVGIRLQLVGTGPRILRQDPPAAAMVQKWTTVQAYTDVNALLPPTFVQVPAVVGQSLSQAAATLATVGLAMDTAGAGRAVAQQPPAGSRAEPGTSVAVTFAQQAAGRGQSASSAGGY